MRIKTGITNDTTVEITSDKNSVYYEIINGFASEEEIRAELFNQWRVNAFSFLYSGDYSERKPAIDEIDKMIQDKERQIAELKKCKHLIKRRSWAKVK